MQIYLWAPLRHKQVVFEKFLKRTRANLDLDIRCSSRSCWVSRFQPFHMVFLVAIDCDLLEFDLCYDCGRLSKVYLGGHERIMVCRIGSHKKRVRGARATLWRVVPSLWRFHIGSATCDGFYCALDLWHWVACANLSCKLCWPEDVCQCIADLPRPMLLRESVWEQGYNPCCLWRRQPGNCGLRMEAAFKKVEHWYAWDAGMSKVWYVIRLQLMRGELLSRTIEINLWSRWMFRVRRW